MCVPLGNPVNLLNTYGEVNVCWVWGRKKKQVVVVVVVVVAVTVKAHTLNRASGAHKL